VRNSALIAATQSAVLALWLTAFPPVIAAGAAEAPGAQAAARQSRVSSGLSEVNIQAFEQLQAPHWGRDPFAQPTKQEAMAGTLELTAILYSPSSPVAVVNGQVLHVGDTVAGRQVVTIGPDHITLREGNGIRRLDVPRFTAGQGKP